MKLAREQILAYLDTLNPDSGDFKELVASQLSRVDRYKGLGTPLYKAVAAQSWNNYIESVALRRNPTNARVLEVFLTQRDETDPDWQGYWHFPGTALRPGDQSMADPQKRLEREYGVPIVLKRIGDDGLTFFKPGDEGRGSGISFIHLTKLEGDPKVDDRRGWFDVNDLPQPIVPSHVGMIEKAVRVFRAHSNIRTNFTVDGRNFEAVGFLNDYEGSVHGVEMFKRTNGENDGPIQNADTDFLWERRNEWPTSLQDYHLVTNHHYIADDPRDKIRFVCKDGQWHQELVYIGDQFDKCNLVLRRCK